VINDINNAVPGEKLKLFADDTNLLVQGPDICHASDHANLLLSKLHSWFVANKLTLSLPKTCYTVFGKNRNDTCVLKRPMPAQRTLDPQLCSYTFYAPVSHARPSPHNPCT